jgi:hypothetical protein
VLDRGAHADARSATHVLDRGVLSIRVLENHVFLGTRIDRKISARDVFLSARLAGAPLPGKISQKLSS